MITWFFSFHGAHHSRGDSSRLYVLHTGPLLLMVELILMFGICAASIGPGIGTQALAEWLQPCPSECWLVHSSALCWVPEVWICTGQPWNWDWCMGAHGVTVFPSSRVLTSHSSNYALYVPSDHKARVRVVGTYRVTANLGLWVLTSLQQIWLWWLKHRYMGSSCRPAESGAQTNVEWLQSQSVKHLCAQRDLVVRIWDQAHGLRNICKAVRAGSPDPRQHNLSSAWGKCSSISFPRGFWQLWLLVISVAKLLKVLSRPGCGGEHWQTLQGSLLWRLLGVHGCCECS